MNAPPSKLPVPLVLVLLAGFAVGVLAEYAIFWKAKPLRPCATHLGSPTGNV